MAGRACRFAVTVDPLHGRRTSLTPVTPDDLADIEPWYREAVAAVQGIPLAEAPGIEALHEQLAAAEEERGRVLVIRDVATGPPFGLLDFRADHPYRGELTIGWLAIAAGRRGFGYGSEAVFLLEDWGAARNIKRFRANVGARNGLGLYFWLRLGYVPSEPSVDSQGRAVQPMVRTLGMMQSTLR